MDSIPPLSPDPHTETPLPAAALAAAALQRAGPAGLVLAAAGEARATAIAEAARALAGTDVEILSLPGWDCLPHDAVAPSRSVMGRRMETVRRLSEPATRPRILVASIETLLQRLPPPRAAEPLRLRPADTLDPAALRLALARLGYAVLEHADNPGEAVFGTAVIDIFPAAGERPVRLRAAADWSEPGPIALIDVFDPVSQRSLHTLQDIEIGPATELPATPDRTMDGPIADGPIADGPIADGTVEDGHLEDEPPDAVHRLTRHYETLHAPLDLLPGAALCIESGAEDLVGARLAELADAAAARTAMARATGGPLPDTALYLDHLPHGDPIGDRDIVDLPDFGGRDALQACVRAVTGWLGEGRRVALGGERLAVAVASVLEREVVPLAGWRALLESPPGTLAMLPDPPAPGFTAPAAVLIASGDLFPTLPGNAGHAVFAEPPLRPGDAVIHLDHGLGALRGLTTVETDETSVDCLSLEYAGGKRLLVPIDELDRVWRYGADADEVRLDRIDGDSWNHRRAEVEAQIEETAAGLAGQAAARAALPGPVLRPARRRMDRFNAGFAFTPTPDQQAAFDAILADLAAGRPMDRLVCGDVGYGKTEVALRAAAAAVLAGAQVAVLAPTTVLVRQHLASFRRRFARLGIAVGGLSRLTAPAEARATRAGLADGTLRIAVGTQALAGDAVRYAALGLLIIDEEQRFGARQKAALQALRGRSAVHTLTLTATPIPRTLQAALAGLHELSVLTTPPARRQPVRTEVMAFDPAVVRTALDRERRRAGQSFVVCPRIEDLDEMAGRLRAATAGWRPALRVFEAHGGMRPDALDDAMTRFASGEGDVLLSTTIVESGLDIPRANTMLILGAERLGLAQLHQLRGRVGRGRMRGAVFLFTEHDPAAVGRPTGAMKRLRALAEHDGLGAGFAIAASDLDLRGAGDLLGDRQAGHVRLIGVGLYQHLLGQALARQRGETVEAAWRPVLSVDIPAALPASYIADEAARIDLHVRLGRGDPAEALEDEIVDRFGPMPPPVRGLLALARLRAGCRRLGVTRLEAGPAGAAATLREPQGVAGLDRRGERLFLARSSGTPEARLQAAEALLARLRRHRMTEQA